MLQKQVISSWLQNLQNNICSELEKLDTQSTFVEDAWQRVGGGGGKTRVIENGRVIEKGGVNFSEVWGNLSPQIAQKLGLQNEQNPTLAPYFYATGVSIVLHPINPFMPIIHMNIRYFETNEQVYWFGGGIDVTPHYIDTEQARFFHTQLKNTCDAHNIAYYPAFKKWADDYFFITHRNETRGIGGIFFDRLQHTSSFSQAQLYAFWQAIGNLFAPTYAYFVQKNAQLPYNLNHQKWQYIRRSRYAEFNLVYDKGTQFGLETQGRTESILMSLPPTAQWHYNHQPAPNTPEYSTLNLLKKDVDWVNIS